jgi:uncharacterized protein (DUF433 family)
MTNEQRALIVRDPKVCHGQATVRGTRIMVSIILDALADGTTESEILAEYPTLTVEGIRMTWESKCSERPMSLSFSKTDHPCWLAL